MKRSVDINLIIFFIHITGNGKRQPLEQCFETNQEVMVSFNADEEIQVPFEKTIQGNTISFICCQNDVYDLVLPKSTKIVNLEKKALPSTGPGRLLIMDKALTIGQALEKVKGHLGLAHLRIAIAVNRNLGTSRVLLFLKKKVNSRKAVFPFIICV